jgi:hypothetical protein
MTPRFVIDPICPLVLDGHLLSDGPRTVPCRRIVNRYNVLEGLGVETCPALDEMQVLASTTEIVLWREIRDIDD